MAAREECHMEDDTPDTDQSNAPDAIRILTMDAVQKASSGHPGMPMGMAEIATALWLDHLSFNPANPSWIDRDRVVLSNGHGSMLLYAVLHLTGYDLTCDDIERFRQLGSRTPGHPERGETPGVETTTGPLGQGFANAVGMAIAERNLAASFNVPEQAIVDHHTYVFVGDGCLMEGISHEAASLAGFLRLGKLIAIYDQNGISIDGEITGWFGDDTPARFRAYGWDVIDAVDGHDRDAVSSAIAAAKAESERPTLICCRTEIGRGAPTKAGRAEAHGAPLGEDEIAVVRKRLGWSAPPFEIPPAIRAKWDRRAQGSRLEAEWAERFDRYRAAHPDLAAELERRMAGGLSEDFEAVAARIRDNAAEAQETVASRKASQATIAAYAESVPELVGGAADLTDSTATRVKSQHPMRPGEAGDFIFYGVREFAMAALMNGMAAHGGIRPYAGTYLVFSDYARNALRMASLMKLGVIHVLTHDSIALGQDGPTHQPVEHLASLRLIPGLDVWRPCDSVETAVAWEQALRNTSMPTALILSRQPLPWQRRDATTLGAIRRGGYVLVAEKNPLSVVLIATGAEVALAVEAAAALEAENIGARVVSMPSTLAFDSQDRAYRQSVLPPGVCRVAVEAGCTDYWRRYVGLDGAVVGLDRFGESAPPDDLFRHFGLTAHAVADAARHVIDSAGKVA